MMTMTIDLTISREDDDDDGAGLENFKASVFFIFGCAVPVDDVVLTTSCDLLAMTYVNNVPAINR
jgi:hypothetical protein